VKKWEDGGLILDGNIDKGIDEAFNDGRYVEAFQLLHARIDLFMIHNYQNYRISKGTATPEEMQEMLDSHRYSFVGSMNFLRDVGIITSEDLKRLNSFNSLRNKIVHRLIVHSYQPRPRNKVTEAEAKEGFKNGKELAALLRSKTGPTLSGYPK